MVVVTGTTMGAGFTVEEAEEAEQIESLLSRCGDGERVSCTGSSVGLESGGGEEAVVAKFSVGSFGGEFDGDGMNGGASTFKGFPNACPSTRVGVTVGVGRDLKRI